MRKSISLRSLFCFALLFCFAALAPASLPAQDVAPVTAQAIPSAEKVLAVTMPSDPSELMLLATKTNGLTGDDVKPWHLKASYTSLDEQGNVKDQGTYEEFWVSPKKFKRTFTGTAFTQTEYGTEKGFLVSGAQNELPSLVAQLRNELVGSMPSPESIERTSFDLKRREVDNLEFDCLSSMTTAGFHFGTTWCLDAGTSILRINAPQQGAQVARNSIVKFQGRYIAEDLDFDQHAKRVLIAHIDTIELLTTFDEALFLPPAGATPKRISITVSGGVMAGMLLKKFIPEYPIYAKNAGIAGTVVLQATINKDGRIADLRVVSGPSQLQQTSLDAVKKWVYRPYLVNNEPVEVLTSINVIFNLGSPSR